MEPSDLFDGHPEALALCEAIADRIGRLGDVEVRTTKSQVAFRSTRAFAWVWRPGQYLTTPGAEAVLSIGLDRCDESPRWKEVAHPAEHHWMHHLELTSPSDLDDEVDAWLQEAYDLAT